MAWMGHSKPHLPMYKSRFRENGPLVSAVDVCNKSESALFLGSQGYKVTNRPRSPFQNKYFKSFLCGDLFSTVCELEGLTYMLDFHARQPSKTGPIQREFFEDTYAAVQRSLVSFPIPG